MTAEQPDLFGIEPRLEEKKETSLSVKRQNTGPYPEEKQAECFYLPGVDEETAWPEVGELTALEAIARDCNLCRLRSTCTQVVFGEGPENSRLMLIGEGPGQDEDLQGRPFVGRAGQLLEKILQAAEIDRGKVYITNVVKCRPPHNRLPDPEEAKICRGYLLAQIRLIKPEIIVCLGAMATQTVVESGAKISKVRGIWIDRAGIKIMPTFHPAALLRNPQYKRPVWEDFKMIRDEYGKSK